MSTAVIAIVAARNSVMQPIVAITNSASGQKIGYTRPTRNTPAATIVAEWTSAETGVGPSIASGSHVWSGNWALLPTQPQKMPTPATNSSQWPQGVAASPRNRLTTL